MSTPSSPAPSLEGVAGCNGGAAALGDPALREEALSGDLDGDRKPDHAYLVVDPEATVGCRAYLVAETAEGSQAIVIDREDMTFDLGLPVLLELRQIDGRPGLDAVVDLVTGASTAFAGVFTMGSGSLEQLALKGDDPLVDDLFSHGASIGQLAGADCGERGTVVITGATPAGRLYVVDRRFYRVDRGVLRPDPSGDERAAVKLDRIPNRFPELGSPIFSNCPSK